MKLNTYRRHSKNCPHADKGRGWDRCGCPIWVEGYLLDDRFIRQSLGTSDWAEAFAKVDRLKNPAPPSAEPRATAPITIDSACAKWLAAVKNARHVGDGTYRNCRQTAEQLKAFARGRGLVYLWELNREQLTDYQGGWSLAAGTAKEYLNRLRRFFKYAVKQDWIKGKNPAEDLTRPHVDHEDPVPFEDAEIDALLAAADTWKHKITGLRMRALILLLTNSGLRIGDAVSLRRGAIQNGVLTARTGKTGKLVRIPVPPVVVNALAAIPTVGPYYFWTGASKLKSAVGTYGTRFATLAKTAKVADVFPHKFRHTFSIRCLEGGMSIEEVSRLLGHNSVLTTESFYSAWTKDRQDRVEVKLRAMWSRNVHTAEPVSPTTTASENSHPEPRNVHGTYTATTSKPN
jgi:integrase/recombinase XerD